MIKVSISKNKIKYIQSLKSKKNRDLHGTFVAEGEKLVYELLKSCKCQYLAASPELLNNFKPFMQIEALTEASPEELKKASHLKTPSSVISVFYQPRYEIETIDFSSNLHLVLDGIQDPGNLGTIVRLADWFGINSVICSNDTADIYNPKTVQATMGALAGTKVFYVDLKTFLNPYKHLPIYGTFLEGNNIYEEELTTNGFIVMGNEGSGISREIAALINRKLYIPAFSTEKLTSESLNVASAAAIVCSEFKRRV